MRFLVGDSNSDDVFGIAFKGAVEIAAVMRDDVVLLRDASTAGRS